MEGPFTLYGAPSLRTCRLRGHRKNRVYAAGIDLADASEALSGLWESRPQAGFLWSSAMTALACFARSFGGSPVPVDSRPVHVPIDPPNIHREAYPPPAHRVPDLPSPTQNPTGRPKCKPRPHNRTTRPPPPSSPLFISSFPRKACPREVGGNPSPGAGPLVLSIPKLAPSPSRGMSGGGPASSIRLVQLPHPTPFLSVIPMPREESGDGFSSLRLFRRHSIKPATSSINV